jgi:RimJ/RimL family protein N-acetyltransferase
MSDLCPHATTRLLTERVALREFTRGDVDDILALDGDPQVMRYIGDGSTATRALAQAGIERVLARYAERTGLGVWRATRRDDGSFVGWASLKPCGESSDIEVGYRLMRESWGRGFATELARAMLRRGFDSLGLDRIIGVTHPDNTASQRVLAKVGMRDEGWGRYYGRDLRLFAIGRTTWIGGAAR